VYGALSVRNGQALTQTALSRNTAGYLDLLKALDQAYLEGDLYLVAHNRIQHAFIPVGEAWLHLIAGWWRVFRCKAFAGESLADANDIADATYTATSQLNPHD